MDDSTDKIPSSTPEKAGGAEAVGGEAKLAPQNDIPIVTPPPRKRPRRRPRGALAITLMIMSLILLLVSCVIASGYYYYENTISKPLKTFIRPVARSTDEPAQNNAPSYDVIDGRSWNILVLGSDNDGKYQFPAILTQVIMIIHVDTTNNTVSMVSIPRDSWVNIANDGMHKIDQAFLLGVNQGGNTFESGVQQIRQTIEQDYGITIDRYAWVGLSGFAKVIDTLGGVDIDITHPIVDDTYPNDTGQGTSPNDPYALKRLYMAPGPQHLTGEQALEYVRTRHADLVGDIGRTQRQQQILTALKQKLTVTSIISKLPAILQDLSGQVYTDISEDEMIAFANFARTLSPADIQRITLGPGTGNQDFGDYENVYDPSTGSYQDVIIPNCENIEPVINNTFNIAGQSCNVTE
jgi:polyisoprenyl-teichoic acid--peptidoglycan teichoic acid transferase